MRQAYRSIAVGVSMLVGSLLLAFVGSYLVSLPVLVLALVLGVGGAFVSLRGVIEFLSEVFS